MSLVHESFVFWYVRYNTICQTFAAYGQKTCLNPRCWSQLWVKSDVIGGLLEEEHSLSGRWPKFLVAEISTWCQLISLCCYGSQEHLRIQSCAWGPTLTGTYRKCMRSAVLKVWMMVLIFKRKMFYVAVAQPVVSWEGSIVSIVTQSLASGWGPAKATNWVVASGRIA